jgi:hypothetical protein
MDRAVCKPLHDKSLQWPHALFDNQSAGGANRQHIARVIGRYVAYEHTG